MFKAPYSSLQISLGTTLCLFSSSVSAQVTSDGTVNTQVNQNGSIAEIAGGETRGRNLFHSFQDFSVQIGNEAFFNHADAIENIFSRVTGGNISNIDGAIRANDSASLFLINPAGIIFGENARLDIGGSFYGSTASSILFEDGEFSAVDNLNQPTFTVNTPIGLDFRDEPGEIINRSIVQNDVGEFVGLEVSTGSTGNTLALVGGDVNFEAGEATASGGDIYLGGLAEEGVVNFNEDGSLSFPEDLTLANINLINNAEVDVRGTGGGAVTVNAQNLSLEAGEFGFSVIRGGIRAESTNPEVRAGDIEINVRENINIDNSGIVNQVILGGEGNAGMVSISTTNLNLTNGGLVSASTFGQGDAAAVNVNASGDITVDGKNPQGFPSAILNSVFSDVVGDGGGITISTTNLNLTNGGLINASTFSQGDVGAVNVTASGDITVDGEDLQGLASAIVSSVGLGAEGDAGGIRIFTANLNLINGGLVNASTFGQGDVGAVNITATSDITVDGEDLGLASAIVSLVDSGAEGDSAGITISTTNLNLINGGLVNASTFGQGDVGAVNITATSDITVDGEDLQGLASAIVSLVDSGAEGDSAGITISTTNLNLANRGQILSETSGEANAGNVKISSDNLKLEGLDSGIFSRTGGTGDAGTVNVETKNLQIKDNAQIAVNNFVETNLSLETVVDGSDEPIINPLTNEPLIRLVRVFDPVEGSGNAGTLEISSDNIQLIDGGTITALSAGGDGGNINLNSELLSLRSGGNISATAGLENTSGSGGNIDINSQLILAFSNGNNDITANAFNGSGGNITIATEGIFGIQERSTENPLTNDITTSSEFGLQGDFSLNTPDFDPTTGLINLPTSVGDASDQISQNPCQQGVGSQFIIGGKGGLPPNVNESLNSEQTQVGLIEALPAQQQTGKTSNSSFKLPKQEAVPAMGWVFNEKGEVTLTAYSTNETTKERINKQVQHSCSNGESDRHTK